MDWQRIKRKTKQEEMPSGVYVSLEELIQIQFKAKDFSFKPTQPVNSILSGRYASRLRGRGLNFEEIRRYLPGDDIRTIDWKVTARTRKGHVRAYTEEKDRSVLVIVDQRMNMFFGSREKLKSVTAAHVTALALWRALDVGDRAGAIIFSDDEVFPFIPKRSRNHLLGILNQLIQVNHQLSVGKAPVVSQDNLNLALHKAQSLCVHDTLIIVVSDFMGADKETERLTAQLSQHNDIIGVLVHDPLRNEPINESLWVTDGEKKTRLNLTVASDREKVAASYEQEQQRINHFLRKLSAPLLMISNQGDVVDQVRTLMGVRGRPS